MLGSEAMQGSASGRGAWVRMNFAGPMSAEGLVTGLPSHAARPKND